jgi:hypothetical protein
MACKMTWAERLDCISEYCNYCCAPPGTPCAAYNGPDASKWEPARNPHVLRVYALRRTGLAAAASVAGEPGGDAGFAGVEVAALPG